MQAFLLNKKLKKFFLGLLERRPRDPGDHAAEAKGAPVSLDDEEAAAGNAGQRRKWSNWRAKVGHS